MTEEYDDRPELGFLLTRLSVVLAGAHAAGREVEDFYGDLIREARAGTVPRPPGADPARPGAGASLQELDRLVQLLDNLARFTAALAPQVPEGLRIPAAEARSQILLRDLALALLGRPGKTAVIWAGNGTRRHANGVVDEAVNEAADEGADGGAGAAAGGGEPEDGLHLF